MPDKRAMQKEDLFNLHFLNGGALSPDGAKALYTVNKIDADEDKEFSTIYLHDLTTGETRQMTNGKARDSLACWSPDGKSIAFLSDREGQTQLYLLPADGGEARQLTTFKRGIGGSLAWSPDGAMIAFSAKADTEAPDLATEPYRVDRTVYRFDAIGYLDDEAQDVYVYELASGETRRLTEDRSNNSNLRWAPDGRRILYDANMRADAARAMTPDLMSVDLAGEAAPVLTGWASIAGASYSPDGERIVFIGRPNDGKPIGTKSDLYVLDLASGDIDCRSAGLDVGVGGRLSMDMPVSGLSLTDVLVSDDGAFAYTTAQRGGHGPHLSRGAAGRGAGRSGHERRLRRLPAGPARRPTAIRAHRYKRPARSLPGGPR